jgi:phosphoribosylformylglycinamidine cyclo-ligase
MMAIPAGYREPILVSCNDGVGTKLLVAIQANQHATVGIDLVAMCVNDLLVTGAEPLFLLDYIATGKLDPSHIEAILTGIVVGCEQSGCSLLGGETAELPGMYSDGHYDLAATAVGVVERSAIWRPTHTRSGDVVLALPSSGLHSNGYSLARKALLDPAYAGFKLDSRLPGTEMSVAQAMLVPTIIYAPAFAELRKLEAHPVHGAAHITGGGLLENPQRSIGRDLAVHLKMSSVPLPPILQAIADQGVALTEMRRTFNCGAGMLLYVDRERVHEVQEALDRASQPFLEIGSIRERPSESAPQIVFED